MLTIIEHTVGHVTVLRLCGRLVLEGQETPLRPYLDGLATTGRVKIVLDLRDVTYIDSSGLGVLVAKFVSLRRRGGDLRFVRLTDRSKALMQTTHLLSVFRTFTTEDEAVQSFAPS